MERLGGLNGRRACNEVNEQHLVPTARTVPFFITPSLIYLREAPNPSLVPRKHRLVSTSIVNLTGNRLVSQGRDSTLLRIPAMVDSGKRGVGNERPTSFNQS